MNKLISVLIGLMLSGLAVAQEYATATLSAADTLVSVLTLPVKVTQLTLTATTAAATTFKLYDSTNTASSNITIATRYTPTTYSTNYSTTWTNITGPDGSGTYVTNIFTNSFSGTYTSWALTGSTTTERPRTLTVTVPASSSRTLDVTRFLKFGLTAQASAAGLVEVQYTR